MPRRSFAPSVRYPDSSAKSSKNFVSCGINRTTPPLYTSNSRTFQRLPDELRSSVNLFQQGQHTQRLLKDQRVYRMAATPDALHRETIQRIDGRSGDLFRFRHKPISYAPNGLQVLWLGRVFLDIPPQAHHEVIDRARVGVFPQAPDFFENRFP